jgi:hypothetical protein
VVPLDFFWAHPHRDLVGRAILVLPRAETLLAKLDSHCSEEVLIAHLDSAV